MKILHPIVGSMAVAAGLALATTGALAQDSAKKPNVPLEKTIGTVTPTGPVPSLAVINSAGARLDGAPRREEIWNQGSHLKPT